MKKTTSPILTFAAGSCLIAAPIGQAAVTFSNPTVTNVALNKPTFGDTAFGAPTARGNDGITGAAAAGNWTHADYPNSAVPYPGEVANAPNPYWEVDLGGSFTIDQIVLSDRNGCCTPNRLNGSTITLFDSGGGIVGTESILGLPDSNPGASTTATFNTTYANVARARIDGASNFFQFSEFEAFSLISAPLNWAAGASVGYFDGTGSAVGTWAGLPASNVTDGNFNTISHTLSPSSAGYYARIDLGQEILIDNISLTGRLDSACCDDRLQDYTLEFRDAGGNLIHTMNQAGITKNTETIDVIGSFGGDGPSAQYVDVVNSNGDNYGPQIGELEVFGVAAIPEPSSTLLVLAGSALLMRRRRQ